MFATTEAIRQINNAAYEAKSFESVHGTSNKEQDRLGVHEAFEQLHLIAQRIEDAFPPSMMMNEEQCKVLSDLANFLRDEEENPCA